MSKPQNDETPTDKPKSTPHSDGSFYGDGIGYAESADQHPTNDRNSLNDKGDHYGIG